MSNDTNQAPVSNVVGPADQIIGQIEELFPDWRSYRDLVDCIECTLYRLKDPVVNQMLGVQTNGEQISLTQAEVRALLLGVPKPEFSAALTRLASWLDGKPVTLERLSDYPSLASNVSVLPVGWFNEPNDVHGYQQVAKEFEGRNGTIPLYAAPFQETEVQQ